MHGTKTIHRLNAEACEGARIMAAHNLNHKTDPTDTVSDQIREQRAKAQETIAKITAPTHG